MSRIGRPGGPAHEESEPFFRYLASTSPAAQSAVGAPPPPTGVADTQPRWEVPGPPPDLAELEPQLPRTPAAAHLSIVIGSHPGVGASTVAVAIADAAAAAGATVGLVELAPPGSSGMAEAAGSELGATGPWIVGRRGSIEVRRLLGAATGGPLADALAALPTGDALIVDAGGSLDGPAGDPTGPLALLMRSATVVVVCRATVPSIRRTELQLGRTGLSPSVLVIVGPVKMPGAAAATAGPRVRALIAAGRAVPVPLDARLQVSGVTADPLPRAVASAGSSIHRQLISQHIPAGPAGN